MAVCRHALGSVSRGSPQQTRCSGAYGERIARCRQERQTGFEIFGEVERGRISVGEPAGERLVTTANQLLREAGDNFAERGGVDEPGVRDALTRRNAAERRFPREQRIQNEPQTVHVGAGVDAMRLAEQLLGAEPEDSLFRSVVLDRHIGQRHSEIGKGRMFAVVQQNVGGLDVPVDESLPVGLVQAPRRAGHEAHDSGSRDSLAADSIGQRPALDQFHDEVTASLVGLAGIEERNEPGRIERGDLPRLRQIHFDVLWREQPARVGNFDGHIAAQVFVPGLVDHAQGAAAQTFAHAIPAEPRRHLDILRDRPFHR